MSGLSGFENIKFIFKIMSDTSNDVSNEEALKAVQAVEDNQTPKIIRVLTVCAYLFTVSFAAILLSIYYLFLWEPVVLPTDIPNKHH